MTYLGSLRGTGRVLIDGEDIGGASYEIRVYRTKHRKEARGRIDADISTIQRFIEANGAVLQLEDGQTLQILLERWQGNAVEIVVSGPVPGF